MSRKIFEIALILGFIISFSGFVLAQPYEYSAMTMEEYTTLLGQWQEKLQTAKQAIKTTESEIQALEVAIQRTGNENIEVWSEIYGLLECDEAGLNAFMDELDQIENQIKLFNDTPADRKKELQMSLNKRLAAAHKNKIGALSKAYAKLAVLEKKMVLINLKMR